jgi:formamidopyrimidine-DNA glycosylase
MPELPDVEVRRLYFEKTSLKQPVARVSVLDARALEGVSPTALGRGLKGARFVSIGRRGKYLLARTDRESTLLLHFGMGGDLFYRKKGEQRAKWTRVEFCFDTGNRLDYIDLRLFGKVALFPTGDAGEIPDVAKLGPEPLDRSFTYKRFREAVGGHKTTIHQVLMDQELIAGIGNIFSDEITYQACVRPDRSVSDLSDEELRRVYDKMKWTLKQAVRLDADLDREPERFIIPHRERNGVCPRGNGKLASKKIGGRTSYYCPACQT